MIATEGRLVAFDYAKFHFHTDPEHFEKLLSEIKAAATLWDKNIHFDKYSKVKVFQGAHFPCYNYFIDIWGEGAQLIRFLPREPFFNGLKRLDIRSTSFEALEEDVMALGRVLQDGQQQYIVNTYSKPPATKRMGRDRGGKGFAVGSHKSDLRISCYKRTRENTAVEYQFTGQSLKNCISAVLAKDLETEFGADSWAALQEELEQKGDQRWTKVLRMSGAEQISITEAGKQAIEDNRHSMFDDFGF